MKNKTAQQHLGPDMFVVQNCKDFLAHLFALSAVKIFKVMLLSEAALVLEQTLRHPAAAYRAADPRLSS
jgi:hypothetical protein